MESTAISSEPEQKLPKNCKENRYYYRHRLEILERKKQKRLEDPEYQAKLKAKEEAKKAKEEAKLLKLKEKEERSLEKVKKKAELLGILPVISSGEE
jgi:hypothetical protein